ncbi:unnamed protein product [Lampetra planeri]
MAVARKVRTLLALNLLMLAALLLFLVYSRSVDRTEPAVVEAMGHGGRGRPRGRPLWPPGARLTRAPGQGGKRGRGAAGRGGVRRGGADPGDQGALRVAALGISPGGSQRAAAAAIPHGGYDNDDGGCAISRRSLHRAPSCAGRPVGRRTARRRRAGGDPDDRALRAPSRREEA